MKLRNLIPFHILQADEFTRDRFGIIVRRYQDRFFEISMLFRVEAPWKREFVYAFGSKTTIANPQYWVRFGFELRLNEFSICRPFFYRGVTFNYDQQPMQLANSIKRG